MRGGLPGEPWDALTSHRTFDYGESEYAVALCAALLVLKRPFTQNDPV